MTLPPPGWDAVVGPLRQALAAPLPGCTVEVVARCESTSTVLLARARDAAGAGLPPPALLVAERQTHGRGRQGRAWLGSPGASLAFSLALPMAPRDWGGLSLAVGVALAEALQPLGPGAAAGGSVIDGNGAAAPRLRLKWPNDLWLVDADGRGRKLGGVLIETSGAGMGRLGAVHVGDAWDALRAVPAIEPRWCVVGVGLNIAPQPLDGAALAHGYACCQEIDPAATAPAVLARVAPALAQALRRFEREGFAASRAGWDARDLLRGQRVVAAPGTPAQAEGVADGVDDDGALRLRNDAGGVQRVVAGEVSVRLAPPGAA